MKNFSDDEEEAQEKTTSAILKLSNTQVKFAIEYPDETILSVILRTCPENDVVILNEEFASNALLAYRVKKIRTLIEEKK